MAYGDKRFKKVSGIRCPVCWGQAGTDLVVELPNRLVYARCEDRDCDFTERDRRDLLRRALTEIEKHG